MSAEVGRTVLFDGVLLVKDGDPWLGATDHVIEVEKQSDGWMDEWKEQRQIEGDVTHG